MRVSGKIAGRFTVRGALVTAQMALSLALLVLSGLFVRGAAAGASANPGFALEPLVLAQIEPKLGGYDSARTREAHRAVLERLRSTPGIASVAEASVIPFGDYSTGAAVQREGPRLKNEDPEASGKTRARAHLYGHVRLFQDARLDDGERPRVHGRRGSRRWRRRRR